jgi:putative salt-induced outer membrane protein YdiY
VNVSKSVLVVVALSLLIAPSLLAQDEPPPPVWTSSLGAGLAVTSGNSDTQNLNFAFTTLWDPKSNRIFKAEALYLRGEANEETTVDKSSALARYERSWDRTFAFGEISFLGDQLKGIDYLIAPIVGAGYHIIRTDTRKLSVDGGAGAAFEKSDGLGSDTSPAVRAGESFEWAISPTSRFTQKLSGLWKTDDFDDALYHFDAGIAATITTNAELKLSYIYDYKNLPPPGSEKGDSAFVATVLYKF